MHGWKKCMPLHCSTHSLATHLSSHPFPHIWPNALWAPSSCPPPSLGQGSQEKAQYHLNEMYWMFDCLFEKTKELDLPSVEDEELFFWPAQVRSAVVPIWVFNLAPHFTLFCRVPFSSRVFLLFRLFLLLLTAGPGWASHPPWFEPNQNKKEDSTTEPCIEPYKLQT